MKKISFLFLFISGSITAGAQSPESKDTSLVTKFSRVEVEAEFKGGVAAWTKYIQKNLDGNIPVKNNAPIGQYRVIVRFIVSKTGKISDVVAETDHGYGMEEEVIRILKNGPDWQPAIQDGRTVNAYRRQPVTFFVQQQGVKIIARNQLIKDKENIILLTVDGVDSGNLELESDNGIVTFDSGRKYLFKPANKGKAIITIYKVKNNSRKKAASAYFEVI